MLRSRRMAGTPFIDVHIEVDPHVSVSEGHHIGDYVRQRLMQAHDSIGDVMVHIDPEDDSLSELSSGLPLRTQLLAELNPAWQPWLANLDLEPAATLHYLSGAIEVDLILPLTDPVNPQLASVLLEHAPASCKLRAVRVSYRPD